MDPNRYGKTFALLAFLLAVSGCAHVISPQLRQKAATDLPFSAILNNPEGHRGQLVILGGVIIDTVNEPGNITTIKVLQTPLDGYGFPRDDEYTQGRFLVRVHRYLDKETYKKGRKITLAGEVIGQEVQPLGETQYTYPVISVKEIHLWKRMDYYEGPPYPYLYDYWYWGGYPYPHYLPYRFYYSPFF
jgi:outer membrane lipoprotein